MFVGDAMRNNGSRMLLVVIRRQPMIIRADEGFEERPCFRAIFSER